MPRKSREYYLSNFYHVMIQGDEKKFIFTKDMFKEKIIYLLKQNAIRNDVKLIAYCIMDNHAHILVYCKALENLSRMMLQSNTAYGRYYSKKRCDVTKTQLAQLLSMNRVKLSRILCVHGYGRKNGKVNKEGCPRCSYCLEIDF